MNSKISFIAISSSMFDGTNYQVWVVGMKGYLDANEAVKQEYEVTPLPNSLTLAQIKNH
jgi:hypothetical protein